MKTIINKKNLKAKSYKLQANKGFSTVELIVSIAIFSLITSLTLVNYGRFSGQTALVGLAHEVALSLRNAQVFGLSVREFGIGSDLFPTYGVNFTTADPLSFFLFADVDENMQYSVSELVETLTLRKGNQVSRVCGYTSSSAPCTELTSLSVTFTRPDPEASITGVPGAVPHAYARITISAPSGLTRDVLVWANGQISVQ